MKKKLFALLLAVGMAVSLCACGDSGDSGAAPVYDESPTAPDSSWATGEPNETTEPDHEPMPPENTTDAQIPDPAPIVTEPDKPEGLILWELLNPGGVGDPVSITVYCLNPGGGEAAIVSSFSYTEGLDLGGYYCTAAKYGLLSTFAYGSGHYRFSDDFDKMAIDAVFDGSSEVHAGWIDTEGNFFDVTEALGLQSKSDFDDPVKIYAAGFYDGYFCYYNKLDEAYYHIPTDNINQSAILSGQPGNFSNVPREREFTSCDVTDWIDETHCLVNYTRTRSGVGEWTDNVIFDTESQATTSYVPGDSRLSWNGVVSPDGTKIAFMSAPHSFGADGVSNIYFIPIAGGEPVKLENCSLQLGYRLNGPCQLIDWR